MTENQKGPAEGSEEHHDRAVQLEKSAIAQRHFDETMKKAAELKARHGVKGY